jgi:hypothetical protein
MRSSSEAYDIIVENARAYNPDARPDGVGVQQMVTGKHYELIIGAKHDPVFGATILFGAGGVATETFHDTSLGFPPLNQTPARRLMEETQIYHLLHKGYRNSPPADMARIQSVLLRFSQMLIDIPELGEVDLNPVLASASIASFRCTSGGGTRTRNEREGWFWEGSSASTPYRWNRVSPMYVNLKLEAAVGRTIWGDEMWRVGCLLVAKYDND